MHGYFELYILNLPEVSPELYDIPYLSNSTINLPGNLGIRDNFHRKHRTMNHKPHTYLDTDETNQIIRVADLVPLHYTQDDEALQKILVQYQKLKTFPIIYDS